MRSSFSTSRRMLKAGALFAAARSAPPACATPTGLATPLDELHYSRVQFEPGPSVPARGISVVLISDEDAHHRFAASARDCRADYDLGGWYDTLRSRPVRPSVSGFARWHDITRPAATSPHAPKCCVSCAPSRPPSTPTASSTATTAFPPISTTSLPAG